MRASDSAATDARVHELTITRVLDAPREVVFAAWTDARLAVCTVTALFFSSMSVTAVLANSALPRC